VLPGANPRRPTTGTQQACFFRDEYDFITNAGLATYGLSKDTPKANSSFQTKYNLQYKLLCDPKSTLLRAIGLAKADGKTQRGVFVVDKEGKVLLAQPGSPKDTIAAVKKLIDESGPFDA
jgi:thioredoxin-dependent peroxiredoxin